MFDYDFYDFSKIIFEAHQKNPLKYAFYAKIEAAPRNSRRSLFLNIVFIRFIRKAEYNKTGSKNLRFLLPVICLFILLLLFFTFPRQPINASCMAATALSASLRSIRTEIFISEVLIMWIFAPTE